MTDIGDFSAGKLAFTDDGRQICRKRMTMKTCGYEKLISKILESGPVPESEAHVMEPFADFSLMCIAAGVSRRDADNMLYEELGMSGDEILTAFRGLKS